MRVFHSFRVRHHKDLKGPVLEIIESQGTKGVVGTDLLTIDTRDPPDPSPTCSTGPRHGSRDLDRRTYRVSKLTVLEVLGKVKWSRVRMVDESNRCIYSSRRLESLQVGLLF